MLEVKNLSKSYGAKQVLVNLSLQFEQGKVYGIVGENGAGKTTLLRCIAGLESYKGEVKSSFKSIKNHLGYLETNPEIMSYITGWEYLKLHCVSKEIKTENFEEQNVFDLPLKQYADSYSTGMKNLITELISELKKLNKIVLITSHIFSTLSDSCDEIILLSNGKIRKHVEKGEFDELEMEMKKNVLGGGNKRIQLE